MNLIDKKELMKLLDDMFSRYDGTSNLMVGWKSGLDAVISEVSVMPTIDAEPVRHGKWIEDDIDKWRCSVCQKGDVYAFSWSISEGYELQDNYCPSCGAKMKGEEE